MRSAAIVAFFISGASSLIFQSIWSRMLTHVFGATGVAISTVVTCFMAGLGLGAWLGGRWADRIKHPVVTYGVAELCVGLWGILVPFLVSPEGWLADVNSWLRAEMGAESLGFMFARFLCVFPILLVPTTLMGASLPLLARHFVRMQDDPSGVGARVGVLYSINTFGAVAGVFLGAFVLMPTVGLEITNWVAVLLNVSIFVGIILLRRTLLPGWKAGDPVGWLPEKHAIEEPKPSPADVSAGTETETGTGTGTEAADGEAEPDDRAATKADEEPAAKLKGKRKRKRKQRKKADEPAVEAPPPSDRDDEPPLVVPALARKAAFAAFAVSGAAALCYEVVWSRALAMTIGSSVYSFGIILETFLIGIAGGSAIASAVMGRGRNMLAVIGVGAVALTLLANSLWGVEEDVVTWLLMSAIFCAPIAIIWGAVAARQRTSFGRIDTTVPSLVMLIVPAAAGFLNAAIFEGHLGIIVAAVAGCMSAFLALLVALRRYPILQLATVQLFIALATFVNYLFQDEIPCGFAQLVSSIPAETMPQHVGTVQFFMFLTAAFCTLPATMGMGAMFPMTLRIWTSGGADVGRDVGVVYAGNTLGSIVGAWLPGFILMPLIGLEKTLHVGIVVNLGLALVMLVASAAEGDDKPGDERAGDGDGDEGSADAKGRRKRALPAWHAGVVYVLAPLIPAMVAVLHLTTSSPDSEIRWNLSQMTLGVFRVSLADEACNPDVWGEPDLVYYHDGLSTTVSVERWGRHYALKNNGKVDASNGDDMPTQIMVAAYPLLMHERPAEELDVAVIGWGSGVSVGTSLKFPVRSVHAIELERSIPEASQFFADVNHLDYVLTDFPYVQMDRLTVVNDDGRNYLAATDRMFDVIISEPSNPWITGVSDLFTTDHFRITKERLRPGGIYCQWVQLYELSPENIKTIYRTFASQFEHVVVFAAEDLSSDTVLLGSDSPLPLDLSRVQRAWELPGIPEELERAYVHSPYDVFARTLLGSRAEVEQYAQLEYRHRGGEWIGYPETSNESDVRCETGPPPSPRDHAGYWALWALALACGIIALVLYLLLVVNAFDHGVLKGFGALLLPPFWIWFGLREFETPRRRAFVATWAVCAVLAFALVPLAGAIFAPSEEVTVDCTREPAPLNTDDNALIEFAAPRDLIGYRRYEGYLANIYSPDWPYGRLMGNVSGMGGGDDGARNAAEMAMALIAHGRKLEAAGFVASAQEMGDAVETLVAYQVLSLLMGEEGEPRLAFEAPVPGPQMAADEARELSDGFERVDGFLRQGNFGSALAAMEEIRSPVRLHSGPGMRFLYGYLLYKAGELYPSRYRDAIDQLEDLVRSDEEYVRRHPEAYFFLARAHDAELNFDKALRNMRVYVEARLVPDDGLEDLPEPPIGEAPTTDEDGESDKTEHVYRGPEVP